MSYMCSIDLMRWHVCLTCTLKGFNQKTNLSSMNSCVKPFPRFLTLSSPFLSEERFLQHTEISETSIAH